MKGKKTSMTAASPVRSTRRGFVFGGGIRLRLYLLIALVMMPMVMALGWSNYQHFMTLRRAELHNQMEVALDAASVFATFVHGVHQQLLTVGQAILTFDPYTQEKATSLLTETAEKIPVIRNLSLIDPDGRVQASSLPEMVARDLSGQGYFQQIIAGQSWTVSDLFLHDGLPEASTFVIASAVRDAKGNLLYVVSAGLGAENLRALSFVPQRPEVGVVEIFDRQGVLVYANLMSPLSFEQRQSRGAADALLGRALLTNGIQAGLLNNGSLEEPWIAARVPIPGLGWVSGAARPQSVAFAPINRMIFNEALLGIFLVASAFLLANYLARTISVPILHLEQDARILGEGREVHRDDCTAPVELQSLRHKVTDMAQALIQAKTVAEEANRAKSEFLANMSHELRTPMTVIQGSVEYLQQVETDPLRVQLLEFVQTSGQRLVALIEDLLDFACIEAGKLKVENVEFGLRQCIGFAVEMFAKRAEVKGLRLTWRVDSSVPERLKGDSHRLGQVLINLIGNAVKFTEQGEVEVRVATVEDQVVFTVRDTGIGIAENKREMIFKPFTQVDGSMTRRHEGTGLGLAISKDLVELMGGKIRVAGAEGQGSEFSFTLPLRSAEGEDASG